MSTFETLKDGALFGRNVFKKKLQPSSTCLLHGSPSRATIPQPGATINRLTRLNKNNATVCDSTDDSTEISQIPARPHTSTGILPYSSSASTSSSNLFVNINLIILPSIAPLDNHFYNLNPVGIVAMHWKHFKAYTTIGKKVLFL